MEETMALDLKVKAVGEGKKSTGLLALEAESTTTETVGKAIDTLRATSS
jgi:hypothetical protein